MNWVNVLYQVNGENRMKEIVIKKSKKKVIILTLFSIIFLGLSVFILLNGLNKESLLLSIVGGAGIGLSIAGLIATIKMYRSGDTLLIINDKGFYDYSSLMATHDQLIEWSEVSQIQYAEMSGQQFVNVQLKNPDETLRNLSDFAKKMAKANENMGLPGININANIAVGYDATELVELMNNYLKQANN